MGRLIDANKLIDYFYYGEDDKPIIDGVADRKIIDIIKNQPTAYDVEKVVEELEYNLLVVEIEDEHTIPESNIEECFELNVIVMEEAIDIVKRGGVTHE